MGFLVIFGVESHLHVSHIVRLQPHCIIFPNNNIYFFFIADKDTENDDGKVPSCMEESWYVTPPPCFEAGGLSPQLLERSPMEDLLIEHPSMSVYGPRLRRQDSAPSCSSRSSSTPDVEGNECATRRQPRRTVHFQAQLALIEKRRQTEPPTTAKPRPTKKKLKRQNLVHNRTKRCKKRDRMLGKHIGMHGKRGC